jgi:hypothetical protein
MARLAALDTLAVAVVEVVAWKSVLAPLHEPLAQAAQAAMATSS